MRRWLAVALAVVVIVAGAAAASRLLADDADEPAAAPAPTVTEPPAVERQPPPRAAARPRQPRRFTVSVSGDLLMHSPLLERALANGDGRDYDFAPFFGAIRPQIAAADLALCHVETPMGPRPPATYPVFNTPPELAKAIRKTGWDACSTASNHSLDQGGEGIATTAEALDERRIEHTGSFTSKRASRRPTLLRAAGVKLGFLSYTDATNGFVAPTEWALNEYAAAEPRAGARAILADARRARRAGADAVIVNIHWGTEYSSEPNASQLAVAERLTASPLITAVVGQHPHVVQPIRRLNGKFVVFSEGNLASNQSGSVGLRTETQDGLIAFLRFEAVGGKVHVERVRYLPTWVRPGDYVVLPAQPAADPSHAEALRESRARTIAVAGSRGGVAPVDAD